MYPVKLIHLGGHARSSRTKVGNIEVHQSNFPWFMWNVLAAPTRRGVIFVTGYDPRIIVQCLLLKLVGYRPYAFIYDTHLLATSKFRPIKRWLANTYFALGFSLATRLNGWIVLNDRFVTSSRLKVRYIKIPVGVEDELSPPQDSKADEQRCRVFMVAGTLNEDNGTGLLLTAFQSIRRPDVELHIYGYGPLTDLVCSAAEKDRRIKYHGAIPNAQIIAAQRRVACLVHLRDPKAVTSQYAFPSKLVEYLVSGTPVLSNIFPGIEGLDQYIIPIKDFDEESVSGRMLDFLEDRIAVPDSGLTFERLKEQQSWSRISRDITQFVRG
ncbi:glycosyltransferase [Brevundimonas sp. UBA5936]|uniref:glycosyltransferase n=1 Tax=Brevundimonas sp. UBA5936 TaxID=1946133 RepID=UPI0025C5DFB4|nr:glycosyltransferase [Brevundimonas sp. UBA5936]